MCDVPRPCSIAIRVPAEFEVQKVGNTFWYSPVLKHRCRSRRRRLSQNLRLDDPEFGIIRLQSSELHSESAARTETFQRRLTCHCLPCLYQFCGVHSQTSSNFRGSDASISMPLSSRSARSTFCTCSGMGCPEHVSNRPHQCRYAQLSY